MIQIGTEKKRTATHKEGGKKPHWSDVLKFTPTSMKMSITVMDEDSLSDDTIGLATVDLTPYKNKPG